MQLHLSKFFFHVKALTVEYFYTCLCNKPPVFFCLRRLGGGCRPPDPLSFLPPAAGWLPPPRPPAFLLPAATMAGGYFHIFSYQLITIVFYIASFRYILWVGSKFKHNIKIASIRIALFLVSSVPYNS